MTFTYSKINREGKNSCFDMFKTPTNLPFFYYSSKRKNALEASVLALDLVLKPIIVQPSLDDLWTIENNTNIKRAYIHGQPIFAGNILCNAVARMSRRSFANILIVPNEAEKKRLDDQYAQMAPGYRHIRVVVDPSLQPNELRATYWKIIYNTEGKPVALDGGIQFSPEGFSCIEKELGLPFDYRSYFVRAFF